MNQADKKSWWVSFISTTVILGAFAIAALVLSNIGIQVYKNVVLANDENFELRTSLNYVATKVRQKDTADSVRMEDKEGTKVLVLDYESNGSINETLIYFYDGYLREHITEAGADYSLDFGFEMIEISDFNMYIEGNCLYMTAENSVGDREQMILSLRSGR
jgi:hypothetical protein